MPPPGRYVVSRNLIPDSVNHMFRFVVAISLIGALSGCALVTPMPTPTPTATTETPTPTPEPSPTYDATVFSIDDPMSIWVTANKLRPLNPTDFVPSDLVKTDVPSRADSRLRETAAASYEVMFRAAQDDGIDLVLVSAYRSYRTQVSVYNGWVARLGLAAADLQSARPGHSEHQTGLSADIAPKNGVCTINECFGNTPEGQWLTENAWKFGWVLRYPKGLTHITGYKYEPWHWRYVGRGLAAHLHNTAPGVTLEEFFDLPPAPDYAE